MAGVKRGGLSNEDKIFLRENSHLMSVEDLATATNRGVVGITKFLRSHNLMVRSMIPESDDEEAAPFVIQQELRQTEEWKSLQEQFSEKELVLFEEKYVGMLGQFKEVLVTERTQILQAIKFELLMDRNMVARHKARRLIDEMEEESRRLIQSKGMSLSSMERDELLNVETQLTSLRSEEQSKTNEFTKLQERHSMLMNSLKATRDKRLDKIESQKVDFLGVLKFLQDRDVQKVEGRQMELMKLAGQKAKLALGRPVTYDDGNMDNPILCCDTVNLEPEE